MIGVGPAIGKHDTRQERQTARQMEECRGRPSWALGDARERFGGSGEEAEVLENSSNKPNRYSVKKEAYKARNRGTD